MILAKQPELFVDVWYPPQQPDSDNYFLRSISDFLSLARNEKSRALISIFRIFAYPLQGFVNDKFIQEALELVPDRQSWMIYDSSYYPVKAKHLGYGKTHIGMQHQLTMLKGTWVRFGKELAFPTILSTKENFPHVLITRNPY
jgi:hypothetical protein